MNSPLQVTLECECQWQSYCKRRRELDHLAAAQIKVRAVAFLIEHANGHREQRKHAQRDRQRVQMADGHLAGDDQPDANQAEHEAHPAPRHQRASGA
jgi:hypothetical protein